MTEYLPRLLDPALLAGSREHPAVMLVGPRGCGKTTSARRLSGGVVQLDAPAQAAAFIADPDAALRAFPERPLLLDEWQEVPGVIAAIKRAVDVGAPAGSFILTGSVQAGISAETWPGTGRIIEFEMAPLTQRELLRRNGDTGLIARILGGDLPRGPVPEAPDLTGYLDLAFRGGFPEPAVRLSEEGQGRWYRSFVDQLAARDVAAVLRRADHDRFRAYLEAYALNSAGVVEHATLYRHAGISRPTAEGYDAVLARLFLATAVPAWSTNRLDRLVKMPKRFLNDTGLLAACARITLRDALSDGAVLGRVIESFVFAQLRPEVTALYPDARLHHLRTGNGRQEIDFLIAFGGGRVVAIEVKSAAAVSRGDARHLEWLRDKLGADFVAGVVFHTGPDAFALGDRISALPIAFLWAV